ncbi:RNA polymerase sigma factor [Altericroceibacterium endophyticum]|uniref:Sigma-70 family RNA polymerase sigma factor n=1 Tax=Altericroceibacterium endophyticum TaxID=1808508 RepID=A0A6I4TB93_9SPHN|nr:RNA polymerase sigma factor [Altericroceibacterium endophyticum]MXO67140.1 sigma-70 family RNA polymerase sigma factor [Altericroceibacterium endophyticum]
MKSETSSHGELEDWPAIREAVRRYARTRCGRADVADDVAQEVLARLIALRETQAIGSYLALGFRIADNLMIDVNRRESRHAAEPEDHWVSDAPSLDRALDSQHAVQVLSSCLRRMPPLRREVIIRRRLKEESCRLIGEELAISVKAVEKHITRALVDLRLAFERAGIELAGE